MTTESKGFDFSLSSIKLVNFRGVENLSIDFDPKVTLLIGENGVGKTTVLEAVAKFFKIIEGGLRSGDQGNNLFTVNDIGSANQQTELSICFTSKIENSNQNNQDLLIQDISKKYIEYNNRIIKLRKSIAKKHEQLYENILKITNIDEADKKAVLRAKNKSLEIEILNIENELENIGNKLMDQTIETNTNEEKPGVKDITFDIQVKQVEGKFFENYSKKAEFDFLNQEEKSRFFSFIEEIKSQEKNNLFFAVYYTMKYSGINPPESTQLDTRIGIAWDFALDGFAFDYPYFFEWYRWLTISKRLPEVKENVENAIITFLNSASSEEENNIYSKIYLDNTTFGKPEIVVEKEGKPIFVSQMSSGEKALFGLVADLARRLTLAYPAALDPLFQKAFVIIDEIELHLHPRLQMSVIKQLIKTFSGCQFIITTHSPLIVWSIHDRKQIWKIEKSKAYQLMEDGRNFMSILLDDMGVVEIDTLMFTAEISQFQDKIRELQANKGNFAKNINSAREEWLKHSAELEKWKLWWKGPTQTQAISSLKESLDLWYSDVCRLPM